MLIVGLTGGIGAGKTAASDAFAALGVPIVDTDLLARAVVEPGQPALLDIVETFGSDCLLADGRLDRATLRTRIFTRPALREQLESILHPRIRYLVRQRIARIDAPYCVVVVPLLVESGMLAMMDRVLVIDVPERVQQQRVTQRDGADAEQARRMIQSQASREQRLAAADDVIENSGSVEMLRARVAELDRLYRELAARSETIAKPP
jgi:dephospho-CoA kinase